MTPDSPLGRALGQLAGRGVPGLAAAIVRRGGVEETAGAGVADLSSGASMTSETALMWFSMTKIVTATAVMQLAERGALALDDPVHRHVPDFPRPRRAWPEVRIAHLLSHSSGLANPVPVRWVRPAGAEPRDPGRFMDGLLRRHHRLRFPAGSRAAYSNLGYVVLGSVIAAASGRAYEAYVAESVLAPLAMRRTAYDYGALGDDVARGYQRLLSPMAPLFLAGLPRGIVAGRSGRFLAFNRFLVEGPAYGGLVGPVRDAARFMAVHLNGGELEGVRLLSRESVEAMQEVRATSRRLAVGLGWFRRGRDAGRAGEYLEHLGGGGGFWSMMRIYPQRGLGVVAMGNATTYDHELVARAALE